MARPGPGRARPDGMRGTLPPSIGCGGATHLLGWEYFTLNSLGGGVYDIQTLDGHYVTAVGGGGRTTDTIHTDATRVGAWEKFTVSCGH